MQLVLSSELIMEAYRQGLFPMAYNAGSPIIHWVCPENRGQLSIPHMHIPRSLKKDVRKALRSPNIDIKINTAFEDVIHLCGESEPGRPETWINKAIRDVFIELHEKGHAHSVEYWQDGKLAGGLYGLSMGAVFCGESMFSRQTNASKIALVHLAARLWSGGYKILDTQFINDHLEQFGVYEVPHNEYLARLSVCLAQKADFIQAGSQENVLIENYFAMRDEALKGEI